MHTTHMRELSTESAFRHYVEVLRYYLNAIIATSNKYEEYTTFYNHFTLLTPLYHVRPDGSVIRSSNLAIY